MVILYKCSSREILFGQLRIRFNVALMCKIGIKYQYFSRVVCAFAKEKEKKIRNDQGVRLLEHVR